MTLYLDTEFNGHSGQLISLALVSSIGSDFFYGVVPMPKMFHIDEWVLEHVIPHLDREPEPVKVFRARLHSFLLLHAGEPIIADWPGDFAHLMGVMCGSAYDEHFTIPCVMQLVVSGELKPETPHNALSDAYALMKWHRVMVHEETDS